MMRRNARGVGLRGEETSRRRQVDFDLACPAPSVRTVVAYVGSVDVKSIGLFRPTATQDRHISAGQVQGFAP